MNRTDVSFIQFIKAGILTGICVTVVDWFWFTTATYFLQIKGQSKITYGSIFLIVMLIALVASAGFYFLYRRGRKPVIVFKSVIVLLAVISMFLAFTRVYPGQTPAFDRYPFLAAPIHLFTGLFMAYLMPKFMKRSKGTTAVEY